MKNFIIATLFLFLTSPLLIAQNDNACRALEIPCSSPYVPTIGPYAHYETSVFVSQSNIANFSTNYAISGSQCVNLPTGATLFYKVTINTPGVFTFHVRLGSDHVNNDGVFGNSALGEFPPSDVNFAVWKNIDCHNIVAGNAPYPIRIAISNFNNGNNCPVYCPGVAGLDVSQPAGNVCETGANPGDNGLLSGFNVVAGDIVIIALNRFGQVQTADPQGNIIDIPTGVQLIFGGPWGGGGDNVKCCAVQYELANENGVPKTQFCLGEQVFLQGFGVTNSSFELELLDVNNVVIDKKAFTSTSPDGINITDIFPTHLSPYQNFQKFTHGVTYKLKVIARSPCGCSSIFLDFNFTCCDIDASFSLNTILSNENEKVILQGSSSTYGSHQWQSYNYNPRTGNVFSTEPLWKLEDTEESDFSTSDAGGPCYFIKHTVSNDCGSNCSYLPYCHFNCDDKDCELSAPTNLASADNAFTWNQVPNADSYIIQFVVCDLGCCNNASPVMLSGNVYNISVAQSPSPSYMLNMSDFVGAMFEGEPPCYSWKVYAVCNNGALSMPGVAKSPQSRCGGDPNSYSCAYLRPAVNTGIAGSKLTNEGMILELFPNPTSGVVFINITTSSDVEFNIGVYDRIGNVVQTIEGMKTSDKKSSIHWDAGSLCKGLYLVKITMSGGEVITKKLVIE